MQFFCDVIDECGFFDLGYVGSLFTWKKYYADRHLVWERLDPGLANYKWLLKFVGTSKSSAF